MKVSELISRLRGFQELVGDVEVMIDGDNIADTEPREIGNLLDLKSRIVKVDTDGEMTNERVLFIGCDYEN